jgi:hypothetical protein
VIKTVTSKNSAHHTYNSKLLGFKQFFAYAKFENLVLALSNLPVSKHEKKAVFLLLPFKKFI